MQKVARSTYIKRYLLCLPLLNWGLCLLTVPAAIIRIWLDGGAAQLIASAAMAYAAYGVGIKIMIVWMLPDGLHAKLIAASKSIWINALLVLLLAIVGLVFSIPVLEFYRAS